MDIGEFLYTSSHLSGYLAALSAGLVGYGFIRLALKCSDLVGHLATGLLLLHSAVFLRTVYWDGLRNIIPDPLWDRWYDWTDGPAVNVVFNAMVILAGYHSLKALRLAIPEEIREEYSLIGAAFYPRLRVVEAMRSALIGLWRRFRR